MKRPQLAWHGAPPPSQPGGFVGSVGINHAPTNLAIDPNAPPIATPARRPGRLAVNPEAPAGTTSAPPPRASFLEDGPRLTVDVMSPRDSAPDPTRPSGRVSLTREG